MDLKGTDRVKFFLFSVYSSNLIIELLVILKGVIG